MLTESEIKNGLRRLILDARNEAHEGVTAAALTDTAKFWEGYRHACEGALECFEEYYRDMTRENARRVLVTWLDLSVKAYDAGEPDANTFDGGLLQGFEDLRTEVNAYLAGANRQPATESKREKHAKQFN